MKHCKLRIAWSVAWGITTLVLVALTIRSYWVMDGIGRVSFTGSNAINTAILLDQGVLSYDHLTFPADPTSYSGPTDQWMYRATKSGKRPERFAWKGLNGDLWIHCPTWVPGLFFVAAAFIPLPRFNLRALLIATALLAAALGAVTLAVK